MNQSETNVTRIAVLGPESSGKTTLCRFLAKHFETVYAHEYVRGFLRGGRLIDKKEKLYEIAMKQIQIEERQSKKARRILFCDTELINLKVWSEEVFNDCDARLLKMAEARHYDLYLLLRPDLPWSNDGLRKGQQLRESLFGIYRAEVLKRNSRFVEISGLGDARNEAAVALIQSALRMPVSPMV